MSAANAPYDFMDPGLMADPFAADAWARANEPVMRAPGTDTFIVFSYDLIDEVLSQPAVFSSRNEEMMLGRSVHDAECLEVYGRGWPQAETLLNNDPPSHTRFRKLVRRAFAPGRIKDMNGRIRELINELIDDFAGDGRCEFVGAFAMPLPALIIAEQMGIPPADIYRVKTWSNAFIELIGSYLPHERELQEAARVVEFQHYLKERIDERRDRPRDDMLSALVHADEEGEEPLDDAELLNVAQQIIVAGNTTTTHMLAAGVYHLIRHPGHVERLAGRPRSAAEARRGAASARVADLFDVAQGDIGPRARRRGDTGRKPAVAAIRVGESRCRLFRGSGQARCRSPLPETAHGFQQGDSHLHRCGSGPRRAGRKFRHICSRDSTICSLRPITRRRAICPTCSCAASTSCISFSTVSKGVDAVRSCLLPLARGSASARLAGGLAIAAIAGLSAPIASHAGAADGAGIYASRCAICHNGQLERAPLPERMATMPADAIVDVLTSGRMAAVGAELSDEEKRAVAGYLGRQSVSAAATTEIDNSCSDTEAGDLLAGPAWNGWGVD